MKKAIWKTSQSCTVTRRGYIHQTAFNSLSSKRLNLTETGCKVVTVAGQSALSKPLNGKPQAFGFMCVHKRKKKKKDRIRMSMEKRYTGWDAKKPV